MSAIGVTAAQPVSLRAALRRLGPYLLLAPGLLWLLYFFVWPAAQMLLMSLSSGTLDTGFKLTFTLKSYGDALTKFSTQWGNSLLYSPVAVISGLTYNFLPFMILPLYVALEKIDPRLLEASGDLYGSRWQTFRRVTFPLALPGVFAGSILTFIPAMGDYVNAELLGSPKTRMIGNVIQGRFLQSTDYPIASALSFLLMAGILVAVLIYARALGTEDLTG